MHVILGFTISEWGGIITILGASIGAVRYGIIKPLMNQFKVLSHSIEELNRSSIFEHNKIYDKMNAQENKLVRHDAEIGFLYDVNNLKRKRATNKTEE